VPRRMSRPGRADAPARWLSRLGLQPCRRGADR
jgi:hypothetical protein